MEFFFIQWRLQVKANSVMQPAITKRLGTLALGLRQKLRNHCRKNVLTG